MAELRHAFEHQQDELQLDASQVFLQGIPLPTVLLTASASAEARENRMSALSSELQAQAVDIQDIVYTTRQSVEETCFQLDQVQRTLVDKADRHQVDGIVETKYEEIILHLQKALQSINVDEEDAKESQAVILRSLEDLASSKADKIDLVQVKEQILYESHVRQELEHLRQFIALKLSRDDDVAAVVAHQWREQPQVFRELLQEVLPETTTTKGFSHSKRACSSREGILKSSTPTNKDALMPGQRTGGGFRIRGQAVTPNTNHLNAHSPMFRQSELEQDDEGPLSTHNHHQRTLEARKVMGVNGQYYLGGPDVGLVHMNDSTFEPTIISNNKPQLQPLTLHKVTPYFER